MLRYVHRNTLDPLLSPNNLAAPSHRVEYWMLIGGGRLKDTRRLGIALANQWRPLSLETAMYIDGEASWTGFCGKVTLVLDSSVSMDTV